MTKIKPSISAVILVGGDYDKDIFKKCLESVSWCNEIVKIDTFGVKGGFADWRNEGFKKAKGDWIIYIDTDEEVTKDLRDEIEKEIENTKCTAYAIPRKNFIFEKEFKHGGQYPDYQKRLFLKKDFKYWKGTLHEEPTFDGEMGYLKSPILHHKNMSISEMVDKTNRWSEYEAKLMFDAYHPPMNIFRFFTAGFREFWLRMVCQSGFLDGTEGTIYSLYQVYSRLISYSKLWEMQISEASSST